MIIKRLVLNRLRPRLLSSENFARLQSAYRPAHSTETALLHIMNMAVYMTIDIKEVTALVSLDMWAAFDTIDHHILIDLVEYQAFTWLRSHVPSGRQQFVRLGGHSSTTIQCVGGVPQGQRSGCCSRPTCHRSANSSSLISPVGG